MLLARLALSTLCAALMFAQAPITLDPANPHYFLYNGKTTALITSGEHYGAVINGAFDELRYLDTLKRDGLNYTRLFGGSYVEVPGKSFGIHRNTLAPEPGKLILPWARSGSPGYAGGGDRFDLDHWDDAYFARLRFYLQGAKIRGVIVELTLFSSQYAEAQWQMSPFNAGNNVNRTTEIPWKNVNTIDNGNLLAYQERYVRRLVQVANEFPNVIFEIQNEPWSDQGTLATVINPYLFSGRDQYPNSVDLASAASIAWQTKVAAWIQSEESSLPNKHLIAQNICNFLYPVADLIPGVSIVNFHYAYPQAAMLNYGLNKAIAYDETGFLGPSDSAYRRQAWNFMLSGGGTFDGLDYSFNVGHEDGSDTEQNGPGGGSVAFRQQLGILVRFLRDLPLNEMKLDRLTVVHAANVEVRMLSNGSLYAAYLDGKGPAKLTLRLPGGWYDGDWLNVETGAKTPIPAFRSTGQSASLDAPAFSSGLALLLRVKK